MSSKVVARKDDKKEGKERSTPGGRGTGPTIGEKEEQRRKRKTIRDSSDGSKLDCSERERGRDMKR